jgi:hypothetical protein
LTTLVAAGLTFGVIGLPARFWLMSAISAVGADVFLRRLYFGASCD